MNVKSFVRSLSRSLALGGPLALAPLAQAQTWTHLVHNPPAAVNLMLLLTDGTVLAARNDGSGSIYQSWYRLTPDSTGSYINGTWTTMANSTFNRLYYSSQVLRDGRVFVAGGEYGMGTAHAEVYNPLTNVWTTVDPPVSLLNPNVASPATGLNQSFYDSNSELLPDGSVMIMPVNPMTNGIPLIYNPATNTWANGPRLFRGNYQDEASWVKLPDDTILTIDPFGTNSERYSPALNSWINDGTVPVQMYDSFGSELGGGYLLPDGRAFYLGATGHTAIYTPTGTTSPGTWTAGPDIPGAHGTPDAPGAMLVTGRILCAVSPVPTSGNHFPTPTTFYEYDPVANSFASVPAPSGASEANPTYKEAMLCLPDGNVLYSRMGTDVYVYHPAGTTLTANRPVPQQVILNGDGSYHLTGLRFNGNGEGAVYGDDLQMNTNYPLIRITGSNGQIYYARTYNWSSTSVRTGNQVVSVDYVAPSGIPLPATAVVVANGIASDPFDPFNSGPIVTLVGAGNDTFTDNTGNGNNNSRIDPGESDIRVTIGIRNNGNIPATNVSATLVSNTPTATVTSAGSAYPDIAGNGASAVNTTPYVLNISSGHTCGQPISLTLNMTCAQSSATYSLSFPTGQPQGGGPFAVSYTGPVVAIPDNNTGTANANLTVSGFAGTITNLKFRIDGTSCNANQGSTTVGLDHSFVGDLTIMLVSPQGTTVTLMSRPGGAGNGGNNFCQTVLDDSATSSINTIPSGANPYTGSYSPNQPLSAFNGQNPNGVWHLRATDGALGDTGSIRAFSLLLTTFAPPQCDPPTQTCGSADFNCDGDIGTDADIEAFFACIAGQCPAPPCMSTADFNGDGDIGTDADIEAFFRVLGGGTC